MTQRTWMSIPTSLQVAVNDVVTVGERAFRVVNEGGWHYVEELTVECGWTTVDAGELIVGDERAMMILLRTKVSEAIFALLSVR